MIRLFGNPIDYFLDKQIKTLLPGAFAQTMLAFYKRHI